jgi:hypothetical protein
LPRHHGRKLGYATLAGLLNEDMCQALDQLISAALGVARHPTDRWRKAEEHMHVLAARLYGLLRQDNGSRPAAVSNGGRRLRGRFAGREQDQHRERTQTFLR